MNKLMDTLSANNMTHGITLKQISLYLISAFYILAGVNHFVQPQFYIPLIPDYLPYPFLINYTSGIIEIVLGILILIPAWRFFASMSIIAMLIFFIPSHVFFVEMGSCLPDGLCVPEWVGWMRLVLIHPVLMAWAFLHRK